VTTSSIDIDRPPDEVFDYVTDPSRFVEWQRGVVSGHMESDGPLTVGSRCVTSRKIGFSVRADTSEVTHIDSPRAWGVRGLGGPIRAVVDVTVDPLDDGQRSRVRIDLDFEGHGVGKVLVPVVVRPQAAREMPENLKKLKERLESSPD
jgi:carbon monoxide dehydrogenase subunit G